MKVIFLNLHGARVDAFGAYGGSLNPTPNFDKFASEGIVFDQHYLNWLQLDRSANDLHLSACEPVLLADLINGIRLQGAATILIGDQRTEDSWLDLTGWKEVHVVEDDDLPILEQPSLSDGVLQVAIDWLQQYGQPLENWLLWVDVGALVPPWRQEEHRKLVADEKVEADDESKQHAAPVFDYAELETDEALPERFGWRAAYGGVMHYLDDLFGQFLTLLQELKLQDDCLIVVSSPAGQPLGERGGVSGRLIGPCEERVHLPLLMRLPNKEAPSRRVQHLTQHADLLATLADAFGVSIELPIPAQSLLGLAKAPTGRLREYAITLVKQEEDHPWEASMRTLDWNLLVPLCPDNQRPSQLYRKPEDRWDMSDVLSQHPDVADHLELSLRRALAWMQAGMKGEPPSLRDDVLRILR
jgi:arylsulfatase A-like enzyme